MKKVLGLAAASLLVAGSLHAQLAAQLDLEVLFEGTDAVAVTGGSSAEFDGFVSTDDGATQYLFDSDGGIDGILRYTGGTLSVFGTEAQVSGGTGSGSASDLDVDADGNLYALVFDGSINVLWAVPPAGFGSAVSMVAAGSSVNMDEIAVDRKNDRVMIWYSDVFGAVAEDLAYVPVGANAATPTVLATEATIEVALATHPDYVDDTANDLDPMDMCVLSNGDVILSHGFTSGNAVNGTLLKVTETGIASMFLTSNDLITMAGADPSLVNIGNVRVEALSTDEILVHVVFSSDNAQLAPFIGVLSSDASTLTMVATEADLESDPDISGSSTIIPSGLTIHNMDGKGGGVDANDDYYFYRQNGPATGNAAFKLAGIRTYLNTVSSVDSWEMYN